MSKIYALLVGINDYPEGMPKLQGCVNDIENAHDYLTSSFADPAILVLKDADATRDNVIRGFRDHLGQAGRDDVAMFQYCGHGARSTAAPEFAPIDLDLRDEGLVMVDSRLSDSTFDLADKELAILLAELAAKEPHVAVILDCCNSGSGTRALDSLRPGRVRAAPGSFPPRPIGSYLEGQYAAMLGKGDGLAVPSGRHMLLAAADRSQTAKEDVDVHCGYYTTALYDVLRQTGGQISYAELFVRARAAVRARIRAAGQTDQDPQFEAIAGFDGRSGFLGSSARMQSRSYMVVNAGEGWKVECGAIQGLPSDPAQAVTLELHPEGQPAVVAGTGTVSSVGAQTSMVALDFAPAADQRFQAQITSMPQPPLMVAFKGEDADRARVKAMLDADPAHTVMLAADGSDDGFTLEASNGVLRLSEQGQAKAIRSVTMGADGADWGASIIAALGHVAQWRRSLLLANPRPKLDPAKVDFVLGEVQPGGTELVRPGPEVTLTAHGDSPPEVKARLMLRNRTGQLLNFALVHFSSDYAVEVITNEQVVASEDYMTILLPGTPPSPLARFFIENGDEAYEQLKVILSTERIDDFLLALPPLGNDRGFGSASDSVAAKPVTDDWFTRDLKVKIVSGAARVGAAPLSLAAGAITIAPHAQVTASASLTSATGASRGPGEDVSFAQNLAAIGLRPAGLGGERGDALPVLILDNIANPEALAADPLAIRVDLPLEAGETLIPLTHDGRHILLAGESWVDDDGATQIRIDHVPEAVGQRSLTSALKLYFFKTYLGIANVNKLRWIEYRPDGSFKWHDEDLAAKVVAARNILLVIHGIIGDTASLVAGMGATGVAAQFDLVLSYDYENLSTPIEETARALRTALAQAGLKADDGKRLTILAHSMGGLVSRQMIEQEGGGDTVDRLVMCGTPNAGSPLGLWGQARKIASLLATVGLNFFPVFCGPALALLERSKKLTPTLEQMAPSSPFIAKLNSGSRPVTTSYAILAGDIDRYQDAGDPLLGELLVKAGRGPLFDALFSNLPNDIAVGVGSIYGGTAGALAGAPHTDVACHHLNYFSSPAGQAALKALVWSA